MNIIEIWIHVLLCAKCFCSTIYEYNHHYYKFSSEETFWQSIDCTGGYKVKIDNAEEQSFIANKTTADTWIGLKGICQAAGGTCIANSWAWPDGIKPTEYHNWAPNEPHNERYAEYVELNHDDKLWRNQRSRKRTNVIANKRPYICEYHDKCAPQNPCNHGSICISINMWEDYECNCTLTGFGGRHCDCDGSGYRGLNCDEDINECLNETLCQNGNCTNYNGSYSCECHPDFMGNYCESRIDDCDKHTCQNGATCIDGIKSYTCKCAEGYTDSNCSTEIDECESNPCQNNGNCTDALASYACSCPINFTGEECEEDINECLNDVNNTLCEYGSCVNTFGGYDCVCPSGFEGYNCSLDINECEEANSCNFNGNCSNTHGSFTCQCEVGFTGDSCSNTLPIKSPGTDNENDDGFSPLWIAFIVGCILAGLCVIIMIVLTIDNRMYNRRIKSDQTNLPIENNDDPNIRNLDEIELKL